MISWCKFAPIRTYPVWADGTDKFGERWRASPSLGDSHCLHVLLVTLTCFIFYGGSVPTGYQTAPNEPPVWESATRDEPLQIQAEIDAKGVKCSCFSIAQAAGGGLL